MSDWIKPDWPAPPNVRALVTTRAGGVSGGAYAGLNLSLNGGDERDVVAKNRAALRAHLPAEPKWLKQVHGNVVVDADTLTDVPEADASIAHDAGTVCVIMMADCLPVLLTDNAGSVVGAAHAGWRGLAAGVLENTVSAMQRTTDSPAAEWLAYLGPAIGPQAFEVGDDVRDAFIAHDPAAGAAFAPQPEKGKWKADLFALAKMRLRDAGVLRVYGGGICTYSDAARFYSHRRDKITGRMAALIWKEKDF